MKFLIFAVGHKMPTWINAGFDEYARRMPRAFPMRLTEIKPSLRAGASAKSSRLWLAEEAQRITAAIPRDCIVVVLDEHGVSLTTLQLASRIEKWKQSGRDVVFIIGGADGVDRGLCAKAALVLSLSGFTMPHGLCRVVLAEQIYRALSQLAGHPYHRP